ncbi:MOSC domain-containing protein [Belnapia sp. T18]|uniref:MOSC domain-containing protein n=1 Tax=Belnapia arida TaxID=2804533 RepID=A0ABS1UA82_9PROT|nr:MOSC N-terminal beta barrel domain-containing protein [Belnapia arida]MBL6081598.1 MOSC domain-containing protein [Belnapia arida]
MMQAVTVGRVAHLARYPVKSMAGEALAELDLGWTGAHGDRQYAFMRRGNRSRFPWLTAREMPSLVLHRPSYRNPADPRHSPLDVVTPAGECLPLDHSALAASLSEAAGTTVDLIQVGRGIFDSMPVSLTTTAFLAAVDAAHGAPLDPRRFRINIVIQSEASDATWRGEILTFGDREEGARVLVSDAIPRCSMVTVDPDAASRDVSVLRTVAQRFDNNVGSYCATAHPGQIHVGDLVRIHRERPNR